MAKQQHRMEIKTLARDVVDVELKDGRYEIIFRSPNGASKFAILMTPAQAQCLYVAIEKSKDAKFLSQFPVNL